MAITVTLDSNGMVNIDPVTQTKKRNGKRDHKISWKQGSDTEPFRFICLYFDSDDAPISDIEINKTEITCKDMIKKNSGTHNWNYVVTVMDPDGHIFSSGSSIDAAGGRGVIRNEN